MDATTLLANTLSTDRALREDATQKLELFAQENYPNYVLSLCQILVNEQADDPIRMSAGLALKNSLTAKDYTRKEEFHQRWLLIAEDLRIQIKQGVLQALASPKKAVGNISGQVVAAIAEIELPLGGWPDLIRIMLENISTGNDTLKQSTLQAIGYVCEATDPMVLVSQSNDILTAVVQGARKEEPNQDVRLAAINALINSLDFIKENFEREGERNFIMQVVCEATQSESSDVQVAAFQCLVRIMQTYYDKMRLYMEKALFGLTVAGMNNEDERVALQAIEFWSTVCDEEIELREEIIEANAAGEQPDRESYHFAELALGDILPVLLWILTKQEEDYDEDEWTVSMAAATCLSLLAQCVGNPVIQPIVPFIESNIQSENWRNREAAVMAFGSILDGPDEAVLTPLVEQALPTLIQMMKDTDVHVKDTVAWTLGRICELLIDCIKPEVHLTELVSALVYGLQDSPRIVGNCCWSLMSLAEQLGPAIGEEAPTSALSIFFEGIITALLQFTERSNNEANCRTSAYEAISALAMYSANDCISTVQRIVLTILDRLETTMAMESQILDADDRANHSELQSSLLGVLTNCIRRLSRDISQIADRIMTVVLQLLNNQSKQATTTEDAFLAIGAMTSALEADFSRYTEPFIPILCNALQNPAEYQLCFIAVGLIGDICRALGKDATPYCNNLMQLLVTNLQSPVLHRIVKPAILSCFGDIALAIGDAFAAYLEVVMMVLQQAGSMRADRDNYEMIDYVNTLYEGCVEAYVGIVQGLNGTTHANMLLPFLPHVFDFIHFIATDPNRNDSLVRSIIGLLGDLAETFEGQLKQFFMQDWITALLREARTSRHYSSSTKETSRWAKEVKYR
ncbi:armadillo-type protein [Cokeromyces recurvatus]|uniref:armadillo-type protein n=1 Tax=Cokeromyces recurvatus TaxID=90255 RepID=UPI00221FF6AA|nr:armadillo-type protein [Cokeromyces recurvatus]KAI7907779.1 armadillo-type protein [Cokeromyces recurvatus]